MHFKITDKDGNIFAKRSGDLNKIHTDKLIGYNSIYGEKICHGCLVFLKTIKLDYFKKKIETRDIFKIKMSFNRHFSYNKKINLKIDNFYSLVQNNIICADIYFEKLIYKNKKNINTYSKFLKPIEKILQNISRYVGMVNPGQNSILNQIEICYNSKNKFYPNLKIKSNKLDKRIPIIYNELKFEKFNVKFQSIVRPIIKKKKEKISKKIINKINSLKRNVMIVGASQGVGNDFFNLIKINKKIVIIPTYFKNKIASNRNIISKKIDLNKDLSKVHVLIKKYSPINIYYFASSKIFFHNFLTATQKKELKNYFLNLPTKIIQMNQKQDIYFFYPSTKYINIDKNSIYSKIKIKAEKKISVLCKKFLITHEIIRLDAIQSRQTINLKGKKIPSLNDYINNKDLNINKLLFLDKN